MQFNVYQTSPYYPFLSLSYFYYLSSTFFFIHNNNASNRRKIRRRRWQVKKFLDLTSMKGNKILYWKSINNWKFVSKSCIYGTKTLKSEHKTLKYFRLNLPTTTIAHISVALNNSAARAWEHARDMLQLCIFSIKTRWIEFCFISSPANLQSYTQTLK